MSVREIEYQKSEQMSGFIALLVQKQRLLDNGINPDTPFKDLIYLQHVRLLELLKSSLI